MNVDFPTPGTPEMPTRTAGELDPGAGSSASAVSSSRAASRCSRLDDSTSVIACETAARCCARMPSTRAATSGQSPWSSCSRSRASRSSADSAITVPGRNTAAAPISLSVGTSSGGITPPITTMMSGRPCSSSAVLSAGSRVRWPAASEETPTMCTSASTACCATSSGVENSGPTSTSKPMSAKAETITFWPRSWPSWPILATRMRGRRPSASSNSSVASRTCWTSVPPPRRTRP